MSEQETIYLNAIYQNIKTALQSISDIMSKVETESLKTELSNEQDGYASLAKECELFAKSEKIDGLKDNNFIEKARLWTSIQMSTMTDKTNRKIAELMLLGTFMGIVTCVKDKDDHKGVSAELDEIIEKLLKFERENINSLMPFLTENK